MGFKIKLPIFAKCCYCIPLRLSLLAWGYTKFAVQLILLYVLAYEMNKAMESYAMDDDMIGVVIVACQMILVTSQIVFLIIFVVGAREKSVKLLKVYYIYGMIVWCLMSVINILFIGISIYSLVAENLDDKDRILLGVTMAAAVINMILEAYFLLLIRSIMLKIKDESTEDLRLFNDDSYELMN